MPTVRIRIIAPEGQRQPYRQMVDAAFPGNDWAYPDYCYLTAPEAAEDTAQPLDIPPSSTTGGEESRLRAVARRGGAGIIVASADPAAAYWAARQVEGIDWRSAVAGQRADRMKLRIYGVFLSPLALADHQGGS